MPTYRNDTESRITFPDKHYLSWHPGEAKSLPYFVPYDDLGLTLIDPEPYVLKEGLGYEELQVTPYTSVVYKLPYAQSIELTVYALEGACVMTVGDSDTQIRIDQNNNHLSTYAWDRSAYLTFASAASMTVYVKCEPRAREEK